MTFLGPGRDKAGLLCDPRQDDVSRGRAGRAGGSSLTLHGTARDGAGRGKHETAQDGAGWHGVTQTQDDIETSQECLGALPNQIRN